MTIIAFCETKIFKKWKYRRRTFCVKRHSLNFIVNTKSEFTGAIFFFHKSKTSYDQEVAKKFALQSQHLGHVLKIGFENEKRFQEKKTRITLCQSNFMSKPN